MYKRLIATGLLLSSTAVLAEPYVGIGYQGGAARAEQNALRHPVVDGRAIDASDRDWGGGLKLLAGYRLSDSWAVELSYHETDLEAGFEQRAPMQDEEWESSIEATHLTLAPVYLHPLRDGLELRATAGLLYGDYDLRQSHVIDVENGPDQLLSRQSRSRSRLGGVVGIGMAVATPWKVELLAEIQHQRTSVLSESSAALSAVYRF